MSDEEDESVSEGFSASEDEWKPGKRAHDDGESSDDDDSDFEDAPVTGLSSSGIKLHAASRKRGETGKSLQRYGGTDCGGIVKKRKSVGQSLRAKLYNKYRPPPKTFPNSNSGNNSPTASTSRTASKNEQTPNEVGFIDSDDDGSSSESSVGNHLVNPSQIDLRSSFFNIEISKKTPSNEQPPVFDCNAGIAQSSDSDADDNNENSNKAFDFRHLLEKANSLERAKEQISKRTAKINSKKTTKSSKSKVNALDDVTTLLALGENQNFKHDMGAEEDDEDDDDDAAAIAEKRAPSKLNKTKSTRVKRHTKTRPALQVLATSGGAGESDDSDWEEVADEDADEQHDRSLGDNENLQILVEPALRKRTKESKTQDELELAFKRRLNRDLKEQQLLLHKASLLCLFGRSYNYNRLLNDLSLMQESLKLLPGAKAYPLETGTDVKYFQSFTTWFKTVIKLISPNLYPDDGKVRKTAEKAKTQILEQINKKEARCKQDMIFIYITLLRGMGLQCRLVMNMQPLPLKPSQHHLIPIKLKVDDKKDAKRENLITETKAKIEKTEDLKNSNIEKHNSSKENAIFEKVLDKKSYDKEKTSTKYEKQQEKASKMRDNKAENSKVLQKPVQTTEGQIRTRNRDQKNDKTDKELTVGKKQESAVKGKTTISQKLRKHENNEKDIVEEKYKKKNTDQKKIEKDRVTKAIDKNAENNDNEEQHSKTKDNLEKTDRTKSSRKKPALAKLKRSGDEQNNDEAVKSKQIKKQTNSTDNNNSISMKPVGGASDSGIQLETSIKDNLHNSTDEKISVPNIIVEKEDKEKQQPTAKTVATVCPTIQRATRSRSRSISPRPLISAEFLQTRAYKEKFSPEPNAKANEKAKSRRKLKPTPDKIKNSSDILKHTQPTNTVRILRSRQNSNINATKQEDNENLLTIPQLDGANDNTDLKAAATRKTKKVPQLNKLQNSQDDEDDSDADFEPLPQKKIKRAPILPKAVEKLRRDRRVLSTDNDTETEPLSPSKSAAKREQAGDIWAEVWSDKENQWICVDLFKGKINSVESIRKSASSNLAYVFAFQNDLSLKDVTARYCPNWTTTVRKNRVERSWLESAICTYYGKRTERDIREDEEMRQIHESKPLPTAISDFKDHPLYALERHLLKFQAIYPPNAPSLGKTKTNELIYSRDCVHVLHSRDIWLKQARTVKLGEQPYKIVKARPKWDRLTQTVIKDQPLEIFGYWQTEDYEPPTAENGIVPRNAYGNVELFKECMLPKKTVHLRLPGLNRICKKLNIDCANAVVGFDFHQGACHPTYDGFVICEEFADRATAAWYQDQEEQEIKEQEKYEARVYGNWKKLIKGLLIRERLKKKYNF